MKEEEVGAAPIPAPRDGAECVGGAAPGPHGREAPVPEGRRNEECRAATNGGGVKWFCDVHKTRRNNEGFRITFTSDGEIFRHVDGFEDIPAKAGDRVYVDTIPVEHTDEMINLLRRGVEIYCVRRLTLIARRREELGLPKSERNDVKALMAIEKKWFRRVDEDFLVMRRMIVTYSTLMRTHQQLVNRYSALSNVEKSVLKPLIKATEEQTEVLASKIAEEAGKRYPAYNRLVDELNIDTPTAREALAELMTFVDFSKGFRKVANFLGLFKPTRGRKKIYSGSLRVALQRLTMSAVGVSPTQLTAKLEKEVLKRVWMLLRKEALGRLVVPAQG